MSIKTRIEAVEKLAGSDASIEKPHLFQWVKSGEIVREEILKYPDSLGLMPPWLINILGNYRKEADDLLLLDGASINAINAELDLEY